MPPKKAFKKPLYPLLAGVLAGLCLRAIASDCESPVDERGMYSYSHLRTTTSTPFGDASESETLLDGFEYHLDAILPYEGSDKKPPYHAYNWNGGQVLVLE